MRGLDFNCPNGCANIMAELFTDIPVEKYDWLFPEAESEVISFQYSTINLPLCMKGSEFRTFISKAKDYLVTSLYVQAVPPNQTTKKLNQVKCIAQYKDFLESCCEMIFMIVDFTYGELYVKNERLLAQCFKNLEVASCGEIRIKTEQDDGRTRFSLW